MWKTREEIGFEGPIVVQLGRHDSIVRPLVPTKDRQVEATLL